MKFLLPLVLTPTAFGMHTEVWKTATRTSPNLRHDNVLWEETVAHARKLDGGCNERWDIARPDAMGKFCTTCHHILAVL